MPVDLKALLAPSRSALLMMECQEGIIGGGAKRAIFDVNPRRLYGLG